MTVTRSRQRYDRLGPHRLRYVDLGLSAGFEAELLVDDQGLVIQYQHLFERLARPPTPTLDRVSRYLGAFPVPSHDDHSPDPSPPLQLATPNPDP